MSILQFPPLLIISNWMKGKSIHVGIGFNQNWLYNLHESRIDQMTTLLNLKLFSLIFNKKWNIENFEKL